MRMSVGISHSCWGAHASSVSRHQCREYTPRISYLCTCACMCVLLRCFFSFDLPKGRGISLSSGTRVKCLSPTSSSGFSLPFLGLSHSHGLIHGLSHCSRCSSDGRGAHPSPLIVAWVSRKGRPRPSVLQFPLSRKSGWTGLWLGKQGYY